MVVEDIAGGTKYTGEGAQSMFSQLKSQYSSKQDDDKKKNKDNDRFELLREIENEERIIHKVVVINKPSSKSTKR